MRLMHLVLRPRFSGAEILARDLSLLHVKEHAVVFASMDCPQPDFVPVLGDMEKHGIAICVPGSEVNRIGRIKHLISAFRRFKPDVVFVHSQIPMYYASLLRSLFRHSLVKVIHNACGETYGIIDKLLTASGTRVIGVNQKQLEVYDRGANGKVVSHFVPNGVFLERFSSVKSHNRDSGRKLVVQVGRICDMKGQLNALDALIKLNRTDVDYWVAGIKEDGKYQEEMLDKGLSLPGDFQWLGGRSDIPELLASADVIVMPSAYEAHPIAYLEALASGRPVIANRIGVFQEQGHFEGVRFVDRADAQEFANAIEQALDGPVKWERDLSRFDIAQTAREYIQIAKLARGI